MERTTAFELLSHCLVSWSYQAGNEKQSVLMKRNLYLIYVNFLSFLMRLNPFSQRNLY